MKIEQDEQRNTDGEMRKMDKTRINHTCLHMQNLAKSRMFTLVLSGLSCLDLKTGSRQPASYR